MAEAEKLSLKEFIEERIKTTEKRIEQCESSLTKSRTNLENVLKGDFSHEVILARQQMVVNDQIALITALGDLQTLNIAHILTIKLGALETSVSQIEKELIKSGILKKVRKIETTKKELTKILKSLRESVRKVEESRAKKLSYVQ